MINKQQQTNITKKTYNPFKMFGSYMGAIVGYYIFTVPYANVFEGVCKRLGFFGGLICVFLNVLTIVTIGFIMGYGLHLLLRYLGDKFL